MAFLSKDIDVTEYGMDDRNWVPGRRVRVVYLVKTKRTNLCRTHPPIQQALQLFL